jgi:hypothetical protein
MLRKILSAAALTLFLPFTAQAALVTLGGNLTPGQETTAVNTAGGDPSGFILASLDTDTGDFAWLVTYTGLTSAVNNAHLHGPAAIGVAGGVQIDIRNEGAAANAGDSVDVILGSGITSQSGTFMGTAILDATEIADAMNGLWYVNIHTANNPAGEIRGQLQSVDDIVPVPVPPAAWLLLSAVAGLGLIRRRA